MKNILELLHEVALRKPHEKAVVEPCGYDASGRQAYTHLTFSQLDEMSSRIARGLNDMGISKGTKTALMVPPGLDFAALTFGLFKAGAIIVMIDPGMGIKNLGKCLEAAGPEAFIGIPKAHCARIVLRWATKTLKKFVTVGNRWFWGGSVLSELAEGRSSEFFQTITDPEEMAAILFTSGSTGVAKGVVYTHRVFASQVKYLKETFCFGQNDVDLATFPLFALFDPVLGVTAVIPDMDSSRPGFADPKKLVRAINDFGCSQMFGSPALIDNLSRYGEEQGLKLSSMKRVISAGAPARPDVLQRLQKVIAEDGEIHTPYGATESLPVSSIGSEEILSDTWKQTVLGGGTCVGKPCNSVEVKVISISDTPVEKWSDELCVSPGEPGEIVVKGPVVTKEYYNNPAQTKLAKIYDDDGNVYHRMGDIGRFDEQGRLWFWGRKSHRVVGADTTWFTVPCEALFNVHESVFRTALVGLGKRGHEEPAILIELEKGCNPQGIEREKLIRRFKEIAQGAEHTSTITKFAIHSGFPVDVRHNAKINREVLKVWAENHFSKRKR